MKTVCALKPPCHRCRVIRAALLSLVLLLWQGAVTLRAAEGPAALSTNTVLKPLGNGEFAVGSAKLNKREKTVTFAATVNLVDPVAIEYAVVHQIGKTHEAIFRTATRAADIHVCMLLLGARPAMTNAFPDDLSVPPPGDKVDIEVTWQDKGVTVKKTMEDLILNQQTGKPLKRGPWMYNGSNISEGGFTAQRDGSIISIHIDPDALMNNPRPGRENDDLHIPRTKLLPPVGAPVEVTIRLLAPEKR